MDIRTMIFLSIVLFFIFIILENNSTKEYRNKKRKQKYPSKQFDKWYYENEKFPFKTYEENPKNFRFNYGVEVNYLLDSFKSFKKKLDLYIKNGYQVDKEKLISIFHYDISNQEEFYNRLRDILITNYWSEVNYKQATQHAYCSHDEWKWVISCDKEKKWDYYHNYSPAPGVTNFSYNNYVFEDLFL